MAQRSISIWFFIGALLFVYGVLVLAAGIRDLIHPVRAAVVLANLHIAIWWGIGMIVIGLAFTIPHRPGRHRKAAESGTVDRE